MRLTVFIREDGPGYWSEVSELPGCFASGRTLTELREALGEAIGLYLWDQPIELAFRELSLGASVLCVSAPPGVA
jgi:predicted RNase H-like HicB family nuclease